MSETENSEIFVKIYKRYGPMVFRRCLKMLANEERACEATQDCFLLFFRQYGSNLHLNSENMNFASLLYKIATNTSRYR